MNERQAASAKYYPDQAKLIFIAEAPPCNEDQYFYFEQVSKGDTLFLHIIRAVFPELEKWDTKEIRKQKATLLERFSKAGYLLEYSVPEMIEKGTTARSKEKLIAASQENLNQRLKKHKSSAPLVLISSSVFKVDYDYLKNTGYTVLNDFPLPYPGSGQQGKFKEGIAKIEVSL